MRHFGNIHLNNPKLLTYAQVNMLINMPASACTLTTVYQRQAFVNQSVIDISRSTEVYRRLKYRQHTHTDIDNSDCQDANTPTSTAMYGVCTEHQGTHCPLRSKADASATHCPCQHSRANLCPQNRMQDTVNYWPKSGNLL